MNRRPAPAGRGHRGRSEPPPRSRPRSPPGASRGRGSGRRSGAAPVAPSVLLTSDRHCAPEPLEVGFASDAQVRPSSALASEEEMTDDRRPSTPPRVLVVLFLVAVAAVEAACAPSAPEPSSGTGGSLDPGVSPAASQASQASPTAPAPSPAPRATPVADVEVETVARGLTAPVGLVALPGAHGRALVVEQTGLVSLLDLGSGTKTEFLDLRDRVVPLMPDYDERGLLGLAFHPDFATNGRMFAYYGAASPAASPAVQDHVNVLSEFHVDPAHPGTADAASEQVILQFGQPQFNHSGGGLGFGPDGMLYLATGDGGGQGDASEGHSPQGNAQDLTKLNGKILRIDVDGKRPYAIPADNPSLGSKARREIYAYGMRNPWRLAWEPAGARRLVV